VAERIMGVETEYSLTALGPGGRSLPKEPVLRALLKEARSRLVHLEDAQGAGGIFLANSSRLYVDCGCHPELSTPECTDPRDAVRYVKAGDRILHDLVRALEGPDRGVGEVMLFRGNVDYRALSSWGHHESHLFRGKSGESIAEQLVPHLVSRIVYAGAGGFDPLTLGIRFTLSARAPFLTRVVSASSTHDRGIVHTKHEPLCGHGFGRLHLICGDSLCSEFAEWLSLGATALVVAVTETGARPGDEVALADPLRALLSFTRDPQLKAEALLARGGSATALVIQRHYLGQVEARLDDGVLPPWATEICRAWREALDRLDGDPEGLCTTLDWAIKLRLYRQRAERMGLNWERVSAWTKALDMIAPALPPDSPEAEAPGSSARVGAASRLAASLRRFAPDLERLGLPPDELPVFLAFRTEMLELDTRFAQLGERGVFDALDGSGVLTHRVSSAEEVESAISGPPARTRAGLRGRTITRLAASKSKGMAGWDAVWDLENRCSLDLSDPFEERERWSPLKVDSRAWFRHQDALFRLLAD
jgi:proteasome accessory factor A